MPTIAATGALSEDVDAGRIAELYALDDTGEALDALAALLARDVPLRLQEMEAAMVAGDIDAVRLAAHSMKGSAGDVWRRRL